MCDHTCEGRHAHATAYVEIKGQLQVWSSSYTLFETGSTASDTIYTRLTGLPNLACLPLPLTWVLRIRTPILRSGPQVLYPLSHPPPHTTYLMTE